MKTRTLLLLALGCGLAIMLAGAVLLFQLASQDDVAAAVPIGEPVSVADLEITVDEAVERDGVLTVRVTMAGVDDPDGGTGYRLIAAARPVSAEPPADGDCVATTVAPITCTVRFDVADADGNSRVLFYDRGDEQARWVLG